MVLTIYGKKNSHVWNHQPDQNPSKSMPNQQGWPLRLFSSQQRVWPWDPHCPPRALADFSRLSNCTCHIQAGRWRNWSLELSMGFVGDHLGSGFLLNHGSFSRMLGCFFGIYPPVSNMASENPQNKWRFIAGEINELNGWFWLKAMSLPPRDVSSLCFAVLFITVRCYMGMCQNPGT